MYKLFWRNLISFKMFFLFEFGFFKLSKNKFHAIKNLIFSFLKIYFKIKFIILLAYIKFFYFNLLRIFPIYFFKL
jgi:hypothetical protein